MNEFSGEWRQSSTALVAKGVLFVAAPLSGVVAVDVGYPIVRCRTVGFDFLIVFSFVDDDCLCVDNIVYVLALLKYPFYPLFILDNGMNSISKSLTVLTPA